MSDALALDMADPNTWPVKPDEAPAAVSMDPNTWAIKPETPSTPAQDAPQGVQEPGDPNTWPVKAEPPGILESFTRGIARGTGASALTLGGEQFTDKAMQLPEPPQEGFWSKLAFGVGESWPGMAGGLLGGVAGAGAGAAIGGLGAVPGAILGGTAGAAIPTVVQSLAPAYQEARQAGLDHDAAIDRAIVLSGVQGGTAGAMAAVAGWTPFKTVVGNALLQLFGAQPGVGAVGQVAGPAAVGEPLPTGEELAEGYAGNVITGAPFTVPHLTMQAMRNRLGPTPTPTPMPTPEPNTTEGAPAGLPAGSAPAEGGPLPGAPVPAPDAGQPAGPSLADVWAPQVAPDQAPAVAETLRAPAVEVPPAPAALAEGQPPAPPEPLPAPQTSPAETGATPLLDDVQARSATSPGEVGAPTAEVAPSPVPPAGEAGRPSTPIGEPDIAPAEAVPPRETGARTELPAGSDRLPPTAELPPQDVSSGTSALQRTPQDVTPTPDNTTDRGVGEQRAALDELRQTGEEVSVRDLTRRDLDLPDRAAAAMIDPDGRVFMLPSHDYDVSHRDFASRHPGHDFVEVSAYGNQLGLSKTSDLTPGQQRAVRAIEAHARREGMEVQTHWPDRLAEDISPFEEAPRDTATARFPRDQAKVDRFNRQIAALDKTIAAQEAAGATGRRLARDQDQRGRLIRARDTLLAPAAAAARVEARAGPVGVTPRRPLPPPEPGSAGQANARATADRYRYNDGTSVYENIFRQAGRDPDTASSLPIEEQISIARRQMMDPQTSQFRHVEVDKRAGPRQVMNILMDLHRAAQDVMSVINLPHNVIGLMGRVGLNVDARMPKGVAAFYDLRTKQIHVSQDRNNSFGHEWVHALDHDLIDQLNQRGFLLSSNARARGLDPQAHPVLSAFVDVINKMFFDETALAHRMLNLGVEIAKAQQAGDAAREAHYRAELKQITTGVAPGSSVKATEFRRVAEAMNDPYFAQPWELLARAGESHLAYAAERSGVDPRGFVQPDAGYQAATNRMMMRLYPQAQDRIAIHRAFDQLYETIAREGLYQGPAAQRSTLTGAPRVNPRTLTPAAGVKMEQGPSLSRPWRETVRQLKELRAGLRTNGLYDATKPDPGNRRWYSRMAEIGRYVWFSKMGLMDSMIDSYKGNARAQAIIQDLRDLISPPTSGTGRYAGRNWEELANQRSKSALNALAKEFADNKLDRMTPEQNEQLRHSLITGENNMPDGTPIPANIKVASGAIRFMLNEEYELNRQAGLNIGYARSGFLPIRYNPAAVGADPQGFTRDATRLHQRWFNERVGTPGDNPDALVKEYRDIPRSVRDDMDQTTRQGMDALVKNLRRQAYIERVLPGITDPARQQKLQAELTKLQADAQTLAAQHHDGLNDFMADRAATEWRQAINVGHSNDFDTVGPSSSYLRQRTLPPYAQDIMRNWMHTDVKELLSDYFMASGRRTAFAELFGPGNERLETALRDAEDAGVNQYDLRLIRDIQNSVTGRARHGMPRTVMSGLDAAHALAGAMLMPRAAWNSIMEPINTGLANNSMKSAFHAFAAQFGQIMHTADSYERARTAGMMGILSNHLIDNALTMRSGADYSDSPQLARLMGNFYRANLLTQLTESGRLASFAANHMHALGQADNLTHRSRFKREDAERYFNEMGIPPSLREEYATWLRSQPGIPTVENLTGGEWTPLYQQHMNRATDRSYQLGYKGDRPMGADHPAFRMMFQLQSFTYSFTRNILLPLFDRVMHRSEQGYRFAQEAGYGKAASLAAGAGSGLAAAAQSAKLAGSLVLATLITSTARQYLFAQDQWQKHEEDGTLGEWLIDLAVQRSGLNGTFDPAIQVLTNLRYNADVATLLLGPGPNYILGNMQDVIAPIAAAPSGETNTQYHRQVRAAYNLIGVPLASFLTTQASSVGGPVLRAPLALAQMYGTSADASSSFASSITGPPKTKLPSDELPGLPGEDKDPLPGLEDETSGAGLHGAGAIPWGFVDDAIIPLSRVMGPAVAVTPGWARKGLVAGAGLMGANAYYGAMEPYRRAAADER